MSVPVSAQTLPEFWARLSRLLSRIGHWKPECRPNRLLVTDRPGRLWPWSAKLRMQPPPSSQLSSTVTFDAESCKAAFGSLDVDRSMVLWRRDIVPIVRILSPASGTLLVYSDVIEISLKGDPDAVTLNGWA